jgi:hypothetical protein
MKPQSRQHPMLFEAEIILGNPQMSCERFGICKIIEQVNLLAYRRPYKRAAAHCCYFPKEGVLKIDFWQTSLSKATLQHYFSNGSFLIEKNCMPILLMQQTPILEINISEGIFPITTDREGFLSVAFDLVSEQQKRPFRELEAKSH